MQPRINVPPVKETTLIAQRLRNYEMKYFEFIRILGIEPTINE